MVIDIGILLAVLYALVAIITIVVTLRRDMKK